MITVDDIIRSLHRHTQSTGNEVSQNTFTTLEVVIPPYIWGTPLQTNLALDPFSLFYKGCHAEHL